MKASRNLIAPIIAGVFMAGLALNFCACSEQSPFEPDDNKANISTATLNKRAQRANFQSFGNDFYEVDPDNYPQSNSMVVEYNKHSKSYNGGFMTLPNGSKFALQKGGLAPPAGHRNGQAVTITMLCEKDTNNNELIFTFGPSGCQFIPPAEIRLSWRDLEIELPILYNIDANGNYIEQHPDHIDINGKWMTIYVYHFSRYAVAWSR